MNAPISQFWAEIIQRLGRLTLAVCVELSGARANSAAGAVGRAKALRYDAFEAELARMAYDLAVDDAGARAEGTSKPLI